MNLLFYLFIRRKFKIEFILVVGLVLGLFILPVVALLSLTDLSALASSGSGTKNNVSLFNDPITAGDAYDYGYCTYWAALRRIQIGEPIPNNWGNAIDWNIRAMLAGYLVDSTPSIGAIMQWPQAPGGEGHVAFVEDVNSITGQWTISEMNAVGWDEVDQQTLPASAAAKYNFIHQKLAT